MAVKKHHDRQLNRDRDKANSADTEVPISAEWKSQRLARPTRPARGRSYRSEKVYPGSALLWDDVDPPLGVGFSARTGKRNFPVGLSAFGGPHRAPPLCECAVDGPETVLLKRRTTRFSEVPVEHLTDWDRNLTFWDIGLGKKLKVVQHLAG